MQRHLTDAALLIGCNLLLWYADESSTTVP